MSPGVFIVMLAPDLRRLTDPVRGPNRELDPTEKERVMVEIALTVTSHQSQGIEFGDIKAMLIFSRMHCAKDRYAKVVRRRRVPCLTRLGPGQHTTSIFFSQVSVM
jgi:hypothetical protein